MKRTGGALTELGFAQRSRRGRFKEPSQGSCLIAWVMGAALTLAIGACGSIEVTGTSGDQPSQQQIKERDGGPATGGTGGAAPVRTGGTTGGTTAATGGATGTGGTTATGTSTGGHIGTGGAPNSGTGGATGTGGASFGAGGTRATGGRTGTGGAEAKGGNTGTAGTGGVVATGGTVGAGGATGAAGMMGPGMIVRAVPRARTCPVPPRWTPACRRTARARARTTTPG